MIDQFFFKCLIYTNFRILSSYCGISQWLGSMVGEARVPQKKQRTINKLSNFRYKLIDWLIHITFNNFFNYIYHNLSKYSSRWSHQAISLISRTSWQHLVVNMSKPISSQWWKISDYYIINIDFLYRSTVTFYWKSYIQV